MGRGCQVCVAARARLHHLHRCEGTGAHGRNFRATCVALPVFLPLGRLGREPTSPLDISHESSLAVGVGSRCVLRVGAEGLHLQITWHVHVRQLWRQGLATLTSYSLKSLLKLRVPINSRTSGAVHHLLCWIGVVRSMLFAECADLVPRLVAMRR